MKYIKKITVWLLILSFLKTPCHQKTPIQNITVWESYFPATSLALASIIYAYTIFYPSIDLDSQERNQRWIKNDFDAINKYISIYSPSNGARLKNYNFLQHLADITQHTVMTIHETNLEKLHEASLLLLFARAQQYTTCIVYIEKKAQPKQSAHDYLKNIIEPDFFGYQQKEEYRRRQIQFYSNQFLAKKIQELQNTKKPIFILGTAQNKKILSGYDIAHFSFNIEEDNPSYKERIEILNLLLAQKKHTVNIEKIAQESIGFSYQNILQLFLQAAECAKRDRLDSINNDHVEKARLIIISSYGIDQSFLHSTRNTYIHEMGHAIIAAHFHDNFTLHDVSATPQCTLESNKRVVTTLGLNRLTKTYKTDNSLKKIEIDKQHIMICCAGKIAEQLHIGLSSGKILNRINGYNDFINNPAGAEEDLECAQNLIKDINRITHEDQEKLLLELYIQTFELVAAYKDIIEQGAELLKNQESITGSQVLNLLRNQC